jgi:hypothetical protein
LDEEVFLGKQLHFTCIFLGPWWLLHLSELGLYSFKVVKAFVVRTEEYADADEEALIKELQDHTKQTTAPYKYPRKVGSSGRHIINSVAASTFSIIFWQGRTNKCPNIIV